jgi:hypothetical protein
VSPDLVIRVEHVRRHSLARRVLLALVLIAAGASWEAYLRERQAMRDLGEEISQAGRAMRTDL